MYTLLWIFFFDKDIILSPVEPQYLLHCYKSLEHAEIQRHIQSLLAHLCIIFETWFSNHDSSRLLVVCYHARTNCGSVECTDGQLYKCLQARPQNQSTISGGKVKVQVHQAQPALRKVACNVDNKYSVKQRQALGFFPHNGWKFFRISAPKL